MTAFNRAKGGKGKGGDGAASVGRKHAALALLFVVGSLLCSSALAQRGGFHHGGGGHYHGAYHGAYHGHSRGHVGVFIGGPAWSGFQYGYRPGWYGYPDYAYPYGYPAAVVVRPSPPPIYVERGVAPVSDLWYFCADPQGYYPYVKQCSMAWRTVVPQSLPR